MDTDRSERRRQASKTLAWYFESQGLEWTSVREAIALLVPKFGISTAKQRRSDLAIACAEFILAKSKNSPPSAYLPPWKRDGGLNFARPKKRKTTDARILAFYDSAEWRRLRFTVLNERGRKCECCGAMPPNAVIHVDHIKSLKKRWDLRLDPSNLQVLCEDCNRGKGSHDETDFRSIGRPSGMSQSPLGRFGTGPAAGSNSALGRK